MNAKKAREKAVRAAKEALILDAAITVFSEKGYHESRLEDIAEKAGFSKASLYNYFSDKEEIFLTLAVREYGKVIEASRKAIDPQKSFAENLRQNLLIIFTLFGEHFAFMLTTTNYQTMSLLHIEIEKHKHLFSKFQKHLTDVQGILQKLIDIGRKRKEIASSLEDASLSRFIGSLIRGMLFRWKLEGKMGNITVAADEIVEFVTHGATAS
ncbi:MAG: TetR family transcriptional regulator [Chitinivibrionales bacterium]|nr:TetR family transcriptional regulator [Chitinivibrionales bacterium]